MPIIIAHESDCLLLTKKQTIHPNVCTCVIVPIDTDELAPRNQKSCRDRHPQPHER